MKKIFLAILFTLYIAASLNAQQIGQITQRCPSPNGNFYAFNRIETIGDITYTPCPSRSSIFTGIVNFSGATIVLPGFVTGSGTTNFIPRWTNGAGSVIGNTPFSWNGTLYNFQNTALNNTFTMQFTPSSTAGVFVVGASGASLTVDQSGAAITIDSGTGQFKAGDAFSAGNGTNVIVDDASANITLNAAGGSGGIILNSAAGVSLPDQSPSALLTLNGPGVITSNLLTNGQIPIGSTGANPVMATITAGTGISVTNGAGSISIASTGASSLNSYLAADFTNATTTLNNTLLSVPLAASTKYGCTAQLFVTDSVAADGVKVDFGGGSATFTNFIAGANSVLVTSVTNSSTSTFSNATVTGVNLITINASIEANGAGTFVIRAAQVAHTVGTLTVSRGSREICTQMS